MSSLPFLHFGQIGLLLATQFCWQYIYCFVDLSRPWIKSLMYERVQVEEEKFLLLSSCKISTAPTAAFSDTCSKPYSISLQEEIRIGIKKLVIKYEDII